MRPEDIPDQLPPHPDEPRLRRGETQLASTLRDLAGNTADALEAHDRHRAVVLLTQLAQTAAGGQKAMVRAIQDQMDQVGKG